MYNIMVIIWWIWSLLISIIALIVLISISKDIIKFYYREYKVDIMKFLKGK